MEAVFNREEYCRIKHFGLNVIPSTILFQFFIYYPQHTTSSLAKFIWRKEKMTVLM